MGAQRQPERDGGVDLNTPATGEDCFPTANPPSTSADPNRTVSAAPRTDCFDAALTLQPGEILERRFVIHRLLGCGGMGEVYEAEDRRLNSARVALKTIRAEHATKPGVRERFQGEVLLARSITHPNVCPVYEMFFSSTPVGEICFLTMKLLSGETLASRLKTGQRLSSEEVIGFARDTAAALQAAHQAEIVHRDLKPGNIFLERYQSGLRAVVTDFGLARSSTATLSFTDSTHVAGTPAYLAPELLLGRPASPLSDIYSLGLVLHEMLLGARPQFIGGVLLPRAIPQAGKVQQRLLDIAQRCIDPDPTRRFQSAAEIIEALDHANDQAPILLTRRRALAGAAAGLATLATAGWLSREQMEYWLHPVPRPRRVALLPALDAKASVQDASLLNGILDSVSGELARAESTERDLFVVPPRLLREEKAQDMSQVLGMFGANLLLSAALKRAQDTLHLNLHLTIGRAGKLLRSASISCLLSELYSLPVLVAQKAARLLDIRTPDLSARSPAGDTTNAEAFASYTRARDLLEQDYELPSVDKAIKELQKAVDTDPMYARGYALLAHAYSARYNLTRDSAALELAQRNSDKALKLAPELPTAYASRAAVEHQRGQYDAAIRDLQTAMRLDPEDVAAQVTLAHVYANSGKLDSADEVYKRLLDQRPNMWSVLNDWAWIYYRQAKYNRAEELFREATQAAPHAALPWRNLAAVCLLTEQFDEAKRALDRSIALLPTGDAYSNRATALFGSGKYREAAADYQRAVDISPGKYDLWRNLGDAYSMVHGMHARAIAAWQKAADLANRELILDQRDPDIMTDLAVLNAKLGQRETALELLKRANAVAIPDAARLFQEVQAYELARERGTALKLLGECMRLGYSRYDITHAPELEALRKDPRFKTLQ